MAEERNHDIVFANNEEHREYIIAAVKKIVHRFDEYADIILFGSRARGDWHEESDWDFLILSILPETGDAKEEIRRTVFREIELETFDNVFILFHNREVWHSKYNVTPLYYNIQEEGVLV
jgi:predicted nucleotidyltransferase